MGVLVFVIVFIPQNDKMSTALAKAEIPGPSFGKIVSKLRFTSLILYAIYIVMTFILAGILCALKMPVSTVSAMRFQRLPRAVSA